MGGVLVLVATVALIALSAFFVAVEFALLAARRHRIAEAAATSRSARAALRSSQELTVLLAGSQLGITVCTLALGAVTKPAVHDWLTPVIAGWGAPAWVADTVGFVLALVVVTFLHLVVGEMAPKSWAIAHPERSAIMLALPMRAFMAVSRPLLVLLNEAANACLRRVGVEPVDEAVSGRDPQTLRHLVEHSAEVGTLDAGDSGRLTEALALAELTLGELVRPGALTTVPEGARVREVREAALRTGHLRILLADGEGLTGLVHVRDTLVLGEDEPVAAVARPLVREPADAPVIEVLARMRATGTHLVVVSDGGGQPGEGQDAVRGVVTVADVVRRLLAPTPA
ncbi:CNNM domain-containing protein [Lapillicoccus jejuensis]|uniref:CBS domain containing-hemolysin-like protein n=1 Tax=Lapillicoccus jejuensis TaxID=402171 RepID=A0A542E3G1_9MICO|nr:hemolysin family protein [Lapillicoccus jejuensis]TQJ09882.1 CBS domain containing-hemolysin-like protein [Lapillicoccus jejuensis]